MKFLKTLAIFFFDILDYFHQKKILNFFLGKKIKINSMIDIGAHKGKYADLFLKNYHIDYAILIEPQIKYFQLLKIKYKNDKKIKILDCAVSNKNKKSFFNINAHDLTSSLNSINFKNNFLIYKSKLFGMQSGAMVRDKVPIRTKTIKSILRNVKKKIDLVKIDTEGHEFEVLKGCGNLLKNFKIILIEFRNDNHYLNYYPKKVHKLLIKNNFYKLKVFKFPFTTWEDRIYIKKI